MGDQNQMIYLRKFHPVASGPVLEVGSKDYGSTMRFRDVYTGGEYVGVDMEDGKGVDQVIDLVAGIGGLPEQHFGLVICCSVLEHVNRPWIMADNLTRLLRPGGKIFVSVPWVWRYHAYPDDYFRYSFRGIMNLFPDLAWSDIYYSTTIPGEFLAVKEKDFGIDNQVSTTKDLPNGTRKYLPYMMVNMMGTKPATMTRAA